MNSIYQLFSLLQFLTILILLPKYYANTYNLTIPDDGYKLNEINECIKQLSLKYNNINIFVNVNTFSEEINGSLTLQIPDNTNVSLIGKPTIITYPIRTFYFIIEFNEYNNQTFTIENFTFNKYISDRAELSTLFFVLAKQPYFNILLKNCIFNESNTNILTFNSIYSIPYDKYQIVFDSCHFK
ncbi:hypothetical protein PIROE2DRAFT_6973 [Piromyces sp. E2]|nr:hypothetical protein PIROE2DRAFT_6973 [Piromyces sp. E2]|eukprot:OUM65905.1 hypothetical protein PIROE2DRAFT_6973 [Piromyces sp. E2]